MGFLFGLWLGLALGIVGTWLYDHPEQRAALLEKLKARFK